MKAILACLFIWGLFSSSLFAKEKIKVGIIDTGLDVKDPRFKNLICDYKDFTGDGIEDNDGHGTHIVEIIKKYANNADYCFIILKYFNKDSDSRQKTNHSLENLYNYLYINTPDIVNFSGGGKNFIESEFVAIRDLKNTLFFVAAGNNNESIDKIPFYPASLKLSNIIAIGSLDENNRKSSFSNWGNNIVWEKGESVLSTVPYSINSSGFEYKSGTSQATAIVTGKYLNEHY